MGFVWKTDGDKTGKALVPGTKKTLGGVAKTGYKDSDAWIQYSVALLIFTALVKHCRK